MNQEFVSWEALFSPTDFAWTGDTHPENQHYTSYKIYLSSHVEI
jgi:hypothetical protein